MQDRELTAEQRAEVLSMYASVHGKREVAQRVDVPQAAIAAALRAERVPERPDIQGLSPQQQVDVIHRHVDGVGMKRLAQDFGVSHGHIRLVLDAHGVPPRQHGRPWPSVVAAYQEQVRDAISRLQDR